MMVVPVKIFQCLVILLLCGCSPKCHKASFWDGGYEEFKVNDHEYVLTFKEGVVSGYISPCTPSEIDRILALRAAELTLQNGFTHFDLRRGYSAKVAHIHCYKKEETETAIDALVFSERFSNFTPKKEHSVEIASKGLI